MPSDRRTFVKTVMATSAAALTTGLSGAPAPSSEREYYDLRAYRLPAGGSSALLESYLEKALIPALQERGVGPVGVFKEDHTEPPAAHRPTVWVVIPHRDLTSFADVAAGLNADRHVREAAGGYFSAATKATPAYERIDSWLLLAFAGMPKLVLPTAHARSERVFELRTYESFNEEKALGKIAMFNAGEIPVMREVGLSPVFYGQALAGSGLPHLSYMTSGPDLATHLEHWKAFGSHPGWLKLKNDPQYADTVSQITKRFMFPTAYSQI